MDERSVLLGLKPLHTRRQRAARAFLFGVPAGLLMVMALGQLGRYFVVADVFNHFIHLYGLVAVLTLLSALFRRLWVSAMLSLLVIVVAGLRVAPFLVPNAEAAVAETSPPISVVVANTNYENRAVQLTLDLIRDWEYPDVFVLPECNDRWRWSLDPLDARYPYRLHTGITNQRYGVSLYSRYPAEEISIAAWPGIRHRIIAARVQHPAGDFTFVGAHPRSVHSTTGLHVADMGVLAECLAELPKPIILAGDLNSTPWSPNMARLQAAADLTDARCGRGLMPTWPDKPLYVPFLMLDGVLMGPEFSLESLEVGPSIASDHLPMRAVLRLRRET